MQGIHRLLQLTGLDQIPLPQRLVDTGLDRGMLGLPGRDST